MKLKTMYALDWLDAYVLGHRSYSICMWIHRCSWWDLDIVEV